MVPNIKTIFKITALFLALFGASSLTISTSAAALSSSDCVPPHVVQAGNTPFTYSTAAGLYNFKGPNAPEYQPEDQVNKMLSMFRWNSAGNIISCSYKSASNDPTVQPVVLVGSPVKN